MSEWNIQTLEAGGHRVLHHDHQTNDWSEVGTFPAQMTISDLLTVLINEAEDGDFILLPDGSPVVVLELPDKEHRR